jgi:hypothetical protein
MMGKDQIPLLEAATPTSLLLLVGAVIIIGRIGLIIWPLPLLEEVIMEEEDFMGGVPLAS